MGVASKKRQERDVGNVQFGVMMRLRVCGASLSKNGLVSRF